MTRGNTIEFRLSKKESMAETALYQYDYGQRIAFSGPELPTAYEVHFSNTTRADAVTQIGDAEGVDIPDALLQTGKPVLFWVFLHDGEDDGETEYAGVIQVIRRPRPTGETPTPVQQDAITEAIAALDAAVTRTEAAQDAAETAAGAAGDAQEAAEDAQDAAETARTAAEAAQTAAETAQGKAEDAQDAAEAAQEAAETAQGKAEDAQEAAEAAQEAAEAALAEFTQPTATATTLTAGSDATASYSNGVFSFGIPRGQRGAKGDTGERGETGPQGAPGANGRDGADGRNGTDGEDGTTFTPSVSSAGVISWTNDGGRQNPQAVDLTAAVLAALPTAAGVSF